MNNLTEGIHKIKFKYGHDDKKCEYCGIKYNNFEYFLEYTSITDDLIECICVCLNEIYQKDF